jgi:hypothetical protein
VVKDRVSRVRVPSGKGKGGNKAAVSKWEGPAHVAASNPAVVLVAVAAVPVVVAAVVGNSHK